MYGQWAYKAAYLLTALVIPHTCGACGATLDLSMPAYGLVECVEEKEGLRREGAWRVAAEGSW